MDIDEAMIRFSSINGTVGDNEQIELLKAEVRRLKEENEMLLKEMAKCTKDTLVQFDRAESAEEELKDLRKAFRARIDMHNMDIELKKVIEEENQLLNEEVILLKKTYNQLFDVAKQEQQRANKAEEKIKDMGNTS